MLIKQTMLVLLTSPMMFMHGCACSSTQEVLPSSLSVQVRSSPVATTMSLDNALAGALALTAGETRHLVTPAIS